MLKRVCHTKLTALLVHLFKVGVAWHTIGIYHSAISAVLEPQHHHKASNHPIISKVMHPFYLQCLPFLSLFNQYLFLQYNAAIFIPASGGKMDWLGHLPPQIHIESHSSLNLQPVFYLKAYVQHTEPFRKKPDRWHVTSLILGNNRQHRPGCAKTISSWVQNVLCIAKTHMSLGSLWGALALAAGVSLVLILQVHDWARVSTPARHYFSTHVTATYMHQDSVQHVVLSLSE